MSVLPPEIHTELAQLLSALQSTDNNIRSQGEAHLAENWVATKPELLLMGLVEQLQGSNDATVCLFPSCQWSYSIDKFSRRVPLPPLYFVE